MNSPSKPRKPYQTNLCLQVSGFDLTHPAGPVAKGIVVGHPMMEGEEVSVRLYKREEAEVSYFSAKPKNWLDTHFSRRPSIENFSNGFKVGRNVIPPMEPGALLMLHGCIKDWDAMPDGSTERVWKSQYAESFTKTPESVVLYGAGKVDVREYGGKTFANLDLLKVADAVVIQTNDDVVKFYADYMEPTTTVGAGSLNVENIATSPIANFRLVNERTGQQWSAFAYNQSVKKEFQTDEGPKQFSVPGDMADSYLAAFVQGTQSQGKLKLLGAALSPELFDALDDESIKADAAVLRDRLQSGELKIEAIPGLRIPIVGTSLEELLGEGTQLNRAFNETFMPIENAARQREFVPGFMPMTVSVMPGKSPVEGQPRGVIVSKFVNDENARPRSMNLLRTNNWVPDFTREREQAQAQRAEQAAAKGGEPRGNYEAAPEQRDPVTAQQPALAGGGDNDYRRARDGDDGHSPA